MQEALKFWEYLVCNIFFVMLSAIMIYYFLKFNFKLEKRKNSLLFLVLSFGLVNGIVASLWTNLFEISTVLLPVKQVLLLVISVIIIRISLRVNCLKAALGFVVFLLSTGVGSALVSPILNITEEEALSNLSTYIIANIIIYVVAIVLMVILQLVIKLVQKIIGKTNDKQASVH